MMLLLNESQPSKVYQRYPVCRQQYMRHTDSLNWQNSSTLKSLSLKWEFFLLKTKKNDDDEIIRNQKKRKNKN